MGGTARNVAQRLATSRACGAEGQASAGCAEKGEAGISRKIRRGATG